MRHPTPPLSRAFTLIELLVVISIITLLIAILLPALKQARESARRVVCGANLRMTGIAALSFALDNDGLVAHGAHVSTNALDFTPKYITNEYPRLISTNDASQAVGEFDTWTHDRSWESAPAWRWVGTSFDTFASYGMVLESFDCPSTEQRAEHADDGWSKIGRHVKIDYAYVAGYLPDAKGYPTPGTGSTYKAWWHPGGAGGVTVNWHSPTHWNNPGVPGPLQDMNGQDMSNRVIASDMVAANFNTGEMDINHPEGDGGDTPAFQNILYGDASVRSLGRSDYEGANFQDDNYMAFWNQRTRSRYFWGYSKSP